jgi:hypothetical protein
MGVAANIGTTSAPGQSPIERGTGSVESGISVWPKINESFVRHEEVPYHRTVLTALFCAPSEDSYTQLTDAVSFYIGGWIVGRLIEKVECSSCENALIDSKKSTNQRHTNVNTKIIMKSRKHHKHNYPISISFDSNRNEIEVKQFN